MGACVIHEGGYQHGIQLNVSIRCHVDIRQSVLPLNCFNTGLAPSVSGNFISLVTSCVGLREEEP